jgi:hypothetical protein
MESQRTRNGLLFVIAVCLVLIVLRLYSIDLTPSASAATAASASSSDSATCHIYGCAAVNGTTCSGGWVPLKAAP